ncbi:MAG TPA: hypothetical protein DCP75_08160 [Haliea salexigens]|uniref:DUF1652 domain-containing protein n=1 Tax=Haliea salexigens TaxID=287487 RepID=A0A3C1KLT6_9GAMM|nr:hypothetical protein [Haliea sp.]HAN27679.1 hypothetical protein [Haliea salexigens]|tara:strand:- start:1666 stop:1956 length:291 start_codon:yes stop_codon:yes gene_type:complete
MMKLTDVLSDRYAPYVARCPGDYAEAISVRHLDGREFQAVLECKSGHTIVQTFGVPGSLPVCDDVVSVLTSMLFRGTGLIDAALKKRLPSEPEVVH